LQITQVENRGKPGDRAELSKWKCFSAVEGVKASAPKSRQKSMGSEENTPTTHKTKELSGPKLTQAAVEEE